MVRFFDVWPSVLSLNNLKLHPEPMTPKAVKTIRIQEKFILRLIFNPGVRLTAFEQPGSDYDASI